MMASRTTAVFGVLALMASTSPTVVARQAPRPASPSREAIIAAARDVIQQARYCALVTIGEDGHPQARIVDPIAPDADFTMWVATNPLTRKVRELRRDSRVTLNCFDATTSSYATVLGRASFVTDPREKQRRWKDDWTPIYPKGPLSSDVLLIRVTPTRLEIVSESRGMVGDPKTGVRSRSSFRGASGGRCCRASIHRAY